ncbi:MAG: type IV pilin N-terminal domain-containing protein [Methanomicrobiaceae archaeon]|nr:type IV pilin N-terminal domain-containing protein [Methanomicrobiaceae archaeon]
MQSLIQDEDAASPQIGTVLMVAITVILAATALMYFSGMIGQAEDQYTVAVSTTTLPNYHVVLTYHGGNDEEYLERLDWHVYNRLGAEATNYTVEYVENPPVGWKADIIDLSTDTNPPHSIVVVGTFTDGKQQVLLDKTL